MTADMTASDPLKTAADAMSLAVQAAKHGAADAKDRVEEAMPAIGRFFSRFTYTTFYPISYRVVFPTMLVVRAVPKDNALVHGLIDGSHAARDSVAGFKGDTAHHEHHEHHEGAPATS